MLLCHIKVRDMIEEQQGHGKNSSSLLLLYFAIVFDIQQRHADHGGVQRENHSIFRQTHDVEPFQPADLDDLQKPLLHEGIIRVVHQRLHWRICNSKTRYIERTRLHTPYLLPVRNPTHALNAWYEFRTANNVCGG